MESAFPAPGLLQNTPTLPSNFKKGDVFQFAVILHILGKQKLDTNEPPQAQLSQSQQTPSPFIGSPCLQYI